MPMQTRGSTGSRPSQLSVRFMGTELVAWPRPNTPNVCVSPLQRGGPQNWLHHAEHPVHAHREQGDCYRRGADGEQAKRKCLH